MPTPSASTRPRARRLLVIAALLGGTAMLTAAAPPSVAARDDHHGHAYLALGDSVPFGYITQAGFMYGNPTNFVGYPERIGIDRGLDVVNLSCPGQTSTSLITGANPDNGCITYRSRAPLHVPYQGSQLDAATAYLSTHPDTELVTLMIGANDAFLLQKACGNVPACIVAGLPALTHTIAGNLDTIFTALRHTGYEGRIVAVTYYALDYSDLQAAQLTALLNQPISGVATAHHVTVADAFATFKVATATQFAQGSSCRAGLLNASPQNQFLCDVHPSQSGQQLLARTVEDAVTAGGDG